MNKEQDCPLDNNQENNRQYYQAAKSARYFARWMPLYPGEVAAFLAYAPFIRQRDILDIGCGGGRTTFYLLPIARRYAGCDYSESMVKASLQRFPEADIVQADARNLARYESGSFDCVLFSYNGIDSVSHEGRLQVLAEARRVLRSDGLFIFSSHNRAAITNICPAVSFQKNPYRLAKSICKYLLGIPNYLKNRGKHCFCAEYALLTDCGANYSLLHYYIDPPTQLRQAEAAGFTPLAMYDLQRGMQLELGAPSPESKHVYYVLQKNG